ncbi:MAG: tripartite tricarboxylate transporter TctB family protein [Bacillota bacterium]
MVQRNTALAVIAAGAVYLIGALWIQDAPTGNPWGARLMPVLVGAILVLLGAVLLWQSRRAAASGPVWGGGRPLAMVVGIVFLYAMLFEPLGYLVATAAGLLALLAVYNPGRLLFNAAVAVAFSGFSYVLFHTLLGVYLPKGIFG